MKADTIVEGDAGNSKPKHFNSTHGYANGPKKSHIYTVWQNMKARCSNPNSTYYADYGGRGITVCEQWLDSFETFLFDMGTGKGGWTLDRVNNSGNYEPFNCVWATRRRQANNRRSSVFLEFDGRRFTVAEWAAMQGMKIQTLHRRLKAGWSVPDALLTPVR